MVVLKPNLIKELSCKIHTSCHIATGLLKLIDSLIMTCCEEEHIVFDKR